MKYITRDRATRQTHHKVTRQYIKPKKIIKTLLPGFSVDNPLTMVRLPQRSLSNQSLGKYWQLNTTTKRQSIPTQFNSAQQGALRSKNTGSNNNNHTHQYLARHHVNTQSYWNYQPQSLSPQKYLLWVHIAHTKVVNAKHEQCSYGMCTEQVILTLCQTLFSTQNAEHVNSCWLKLVQKFFSASVS